MAVVLGECGFKELTLPPPLLVFRSVTQAHHPSLGAAAALLGLPRTRRPRGVRDVLAFDGFCRYQYNFSVCLICDAGTTVGNRYSVPLCPKL